MLRGSKWVAFILWSLLLIGCGIKEVHQVSAPVPYVTTPPEAITVILKTARLTESDILYDLGSGDGRIVIAAARDYGARAVGIEIDQKLIEESERNAAREGVAGRVRFMRQDLFTADISEATVVTVFLLPGINMMLAPKFQSELRPGTRIVSYLHDMGEWQPDSMARANGSPVYFWTVPADVTGTWNIEIPGAAAIGTVTVSLRQAFQKLRGSARLSGKRAALTSAQLDGQKLFFAIEGNTDKGHVLLEFSGIIKGSVAEGSVAVNGGAFAGTHAWSAARVKQ